MKNAYSVHDYLGDYRPWRPCRSARSTNCRRVKPHGVGGLAGGQPFVALFGYQVTRGRGQAAGIELLLQRLGLAALAIGGARPPARRHLAQVAVERLLAQQ